MNVKTCIALALAAAIPLTSLLLTSGCESTEEHTIDVTPAYTDVTKVNQTVVLSAEGWSDYNWSLSNAEIGSLSSTHGESVTYVVKQLPTATSTNTTTAVIQTITVTARNAVVTSSSTSGTNATTSVSSAYKGEAIVRHIAP